MTQNIEMNEPNCYEPQVGDRVYYQGYFGFIKYIGTVDSDKIRRKDQQWIGIAWDDATRGKHDGSLNGKRYFVTDYPTQGSFVKKEKIPFDKFQTVTQAIYQKYVKESDVNEDDLYLVSASQRTLIPIEVVGAEKAHQQQSNLKNLTKIGLINSLVYGPGPKGKLNEMCSNVTELDLSRNLLHDWNHIVQIASELPNLNVLIASENRFDKNFCNTSISNDDEKSPFSNVRTLVLNQTKVTMRQIEQIFDNNKFPNLEELHLCNNDITSIDTEKPLNQINEFNRLKLLSFDDNNIQSWSEIEKTSNLSNLKELLLRNNGLPDLSYDNSIPLWQHVSYLVLSENNISSWFSLNAIKTRFPNLKDLRLIHIPLFEDLTVSTSRTLSIARIGQLKSFNGSEISKEDRKDAERYYTKRCAEELQTKYKDWNRNDPIPSEFVAFHPRYPELAEKYGDYTVTAETFNKSQKTSLASRNAAITIKCDTPKKGKKTSVSRKLPPSFSVQKLKMMCSRLFGISANKQHLVYHADDGRSETLDDELRDMAHYQIGSGGVITVEEVDENAARKAEEYRQERHERLMQEQLSQVERQMEHQRYQVNAEKKALKHSANDE